METKELLEQVNAAIVSVLAGGQSYKIGSRSMTRADLATLQNMKSDLEAELTANGSGRLLENTCVAFFEGR